MAAFALLSGPALVLLALSSSSAHVAARVPPVPATSPACRGVNGDIDARGARLGLDLHGFKVSGGGSIRGAFVGDLRVVARREGRRGPDTEVSILVTADTPAGLLRMEGRAFAVREHAGDPLHRVRGWLDVSEGTGGTAIATGRLSVEGTADTHGRAIRVHYTGQLCATSAELAS